MPVRVAACQVRVAVGDVDGNRDRVHRAVRDAATGGAGIIVVPELANSGYAFTDAREAYALAEPVDGPTVTDWTQLARALDVVLVGGFCELDAGRRLHNSAVLIDSTGVRALYRKVHLWDREALIFTPGDSPPPTVDTAYGRISVVVCYDLRFPEWVRLPALAGAHLICAPANWPASARPDGERPSEIVRVQAAASVNRVFIAVADRVGAERGVEWVGGSVIVDPDGWPLRELRLSQEGTVAADIDLSVARDKRISEANDVLADRRPELYAPATHANAQSADETPVPGGLGHRTAFTDNPPRIVSGGRVGPVDASVIPRFAGPATFARLPRIDEVSDVDVSVVGVPFDSGVTYRPGARFGPAHVRQSSRLLRPYNPALDVEPFGRQQVVDAGDIVANPFIIDEAVHQIEHGARHLVERSRRILAIGGDHTLALPMLRAIAAQHGPLAVVHFDAHLDTWDTYFGASYTHGTPFRRASEEGLLDRSACMHVGIRGPLPSSADLSVDVELGFQAVHAHEMDQLGVRGVAERIADRVGDRPLYVSIDIDVLDPAFAPGTGTPEAGGLHSRELLAIVRTFAALNLVGADVVEVAPAYDHAEITGIAAAHVGYELLSAMAARPAT